MAKADAGGMSNAAGVAYGDLIRKYRKQAGLKQEDLGALARVHKNAVGAWEAGRSRPDLGSVPRICEALGLSLNEFFGVREQEEGTKKPEEKPEGSSGFAARFEQLTEDHRRVILREMDLLLSLQEERKPRPLVRIYRNELSACAGPGAGLGDAAGEPVWLYADTMPGKADEIIRVSGDSMEPTFFSGQQVLVRHTKEIREGEIGIFTAGDAGYIKEYRKEGLVSHNPAYPVMRFSENEEVRCIGKVIGILKEDQIPGATDIEAFVSSEGGR